jgi:L-aspartate oxidase
MACNSLLECLVFAERASEDILLKLPDIPPIPLIPNWDESKVSDSDEKVVVSHNWNELRHFM